MSEEIQDVFEDVLDEELLQEVTEEKQEEKQEEKPSRYLTKEQWEASGKNPDEWVSEDVFNERTLRIKNEQRLKRQLADKERQIADKDRDFDNRLRNVNLLAQAQLSRQREELLARRDDAIDVANKAEVKRLDKQISDLDKEAELVADKPAAPNKPPEVVEWEEENEWINDISDPRTPIAQKAFQEAVSSGKTIAYALRMADKAITAAKQEMPEITKKKPAQMVDSPKAAVGVSNDTATLSWNQLKREEIDVYEELFEHAGMSKKDYLKAVADQRKGA